MGDRQVGYPCLSLHGGKDQSDRESTINDFKSDVCNLLVATGVAARGLDVKELVLVVNYDTPNHHEEYVHRVGRTGAPPLSSSCLLGDSCRVAVSLQRTEKVHHTFLCVVHAHAMLVDQVDLLSLGTRASSRLPSMVTGLIWTCPHCLCTCWQFT